MTATIPQVENGKPPGRTLFASRSVLDHAMQGATILTASADTTKKREAKKKPEGNSVEYDELKKDNVVCVWRTGALGHTYWAKMKVLKIMEGKISMLVQDAPWGHLTMLGYANTKNGSQLYITEKGSHSWHFHYDLIK
jgi:hypothetical protein